ncbi:putative bifunctional diguanylate cyclase/phosphodiesterase [Duganella radicis]|uniref:EAL domain-containing protein n=1 Tax=Duganella radicis TaxID=551988 RepID=A0A6L6PDU7_9BURK|nr:EAL domain-containing protein [Duganella radicis]MTV37083.1 EAL domain-containing protein [Duganella radicis]
MKPNQETVRARWLRRGLDTHVSLPLFALLLLVAVWVVTFHEIDAEREHAQEAAADSLHEMLGTYEAQVARSLDGIDQTLRMLKYAVERKGALGALPELGRAGLLPPGVLFVVSIVDRNGVTVASNPKALPISVADQHYFQFHVERDSGATYVSPATRDAANSEWHLHFTRRLDDASGNFAGIVIVETDPAYFTSSYERSRLGERGMLGLVGADGIVRALRTGDKMSFGQRLEGMGKYSGMRELHGIGLNVLIALDEQELMAGFERQRREKLWEAVILSGVLVVATSLVWLWSWQGARTRARIEERMVHLAHHDMLTGLPNRSLISDRLDMTIAQAQRSGGSVLVAFIDLDGFKLVNDGLGHNAGDELLKVVAERMSGCLRACDTVGRFGGDEFVLLLTEPGAAVAAAPVLERVREAVLQSISLCGQEVQVSCSIGVAVYPNDGDDAETLLMNADAAMYRAKEKGKNNCQFYTREMNASIEEKLVLLEGLRNALDDGQFRLVYQPKVELHSGRVFGVEALVRWEHPEQGVIGPDRFIPLAEESGMIVALGEWILRSACAQNKAWQDAGLPPLCVSVNVSPRQFEEARLVERVRQALDDSGLAPQWLELEVTEGVIMRDLQQAVAKMAQVRAMGVSLSIDDFGTGYSSLSALKSFPISTLKIDKSFVRDLGRSSGDEAIASSIIGLAHRLRLRVIAEGVETEQQRSFLRENGCDEMQGYLFSRPLPPQQLAALLSAPAMRAA